MKNVNIAVVEGHLTADPELKKISDTFTVCEFAIGNSKKIKEKEFTSFFQIKTFNKLAELCSQYLKKGSRVLIEGELSQERWTDNENKNKSKIVISASDVTFLNKKTDNATPGQPVTNDGDDVPY